MSAEAATARVRPMTGRFRIDLLSDAELERIHETTLTVLERVGLQITSERILIELGAAGADVDPAESRARFPRPMVEEAVPRTPPAYLLAGRDPSWDLHVGTGEGYLTLDGCAAEVVDRETGRRRPPTRRDLIEATRLADAVDEVAALWPCVAVTDVPPHAQAVHQTHIQLANSTKHVIAMSTYSARDARTVVEMARVAAGGDLPLRARPILSSFQCSISPLSYEGDVMEAAVEFARAGLPCGFVAMAMNLGYWARNWMTYGAPFGSAELVRGHAALGAGYRAREAGAGEVMTWEIPRRPGASAPRRRRAV